MLFTDKNGSQTASQLQAFKDTWSWPEAAPVYQELILEQGPVGAALRAFGDLLPNGGLLAYLVMMAPRLRELHRVLKPTGSIYLHCDPTASHYLKVVMDAIFGPEFFRNELIWKRTSGHSDATRYGSVHDVLLYYIRTDLALWNKTYQAYEQDYVDTYYRYADDNGRKWMSGDLSAAGLSGGGYEYEWKGVTRIWRCPLETMQRLEMEHRIFYTRNGMPRLKRYLDESKGMPVQDVWTDVEALRSWHEEKLGYPTQKPEALLERIIRASSNEGDVVLDPFCGCGTATVVAQKLGRQWIGIDIAQAAIRTIVVRLRDTFGDACTYNVIGEPTTAEDAQALFIQDAYQFQWWATGLVGARPAEQKKGADHGIDGRLYFADDNTGKAKQIVISVKGGGTGVGQVRDLVGVVNREGAAIGVLISMHEPTDPMRSEAAAAGWYESPLGSRHRRVQLLTVGELLQGKGIDYPRQAVNQTFERAPRERKRGKQGELGIG